ncbi:Abi family protein [bacterium]|nr:Abi family protein [bacterium]
MTRSLIGSIEQVHDRIHVHPIADITRGRIELLRATDLNEILGSATHVEYDPSQNDERAFTEYLWSNDFLVVMIDPDDLPEQVESNGHRVCRMDLRLERGDGHVQTLDEAGIFHFARLSVQAKQDFLWGRRVCLSERQAGLDASRAFVGLGDFFAGPYEIHTGVESRYEMDGARAGSVIGGYESRQCDLLEISLKDGQMICSMTSRVGAEPQTQRIDVSMHGKRRLTGSLLLPHPGVARTVRSVEDFDLKEPLSVLEQIKKLEADGLTVKDEGRAGRYLGRTDFYTFTGYVDFFKTAGHYEPDTQFEDVMDVCDFDAALRNALTVPLMQIEGYFRTVIANEFALSHCNRPPFDQHYDPASYLKKNDIQEILDGLERHNRSYADREWMKHHQAKYGGRYPLWVMVRLMSFSTLSKYYACMYDKRADGTSDAERIAQVATGDRQFSPKRLRNYLHCLSLLRNQVIHLSRLYGVPQTMPIQLPAQDLPGVNIPNNTLFSYMLVLLRLLPTAREKDAFLHQVIEVLHEYSSKPGIDIQRIGAPREYEVVLRKNRGEAVL